jgi:hypothetical protein
MLHTVLSVLVLILILGAIRAWTRRILGLAPPPRRNPWLGVLSGCLWLNARQHRRMLRRGPWWY